MSPLVDAEWAALLHGHPDQAFTEYILSGLRHGFRIGFNRSCPLRAAKHNMQSALEHPEIVTCYLEEEVKAGRVLGPFSREEADDAGWQISKFGVIPKRHQENKWRLIVDLSRPDGASVNEGIDPSLCSLTYVRVDEVADVVRRLGRGTELAKADIRAAYRIIPVHPHDRPLLAMEWEGHVYVDGALPFGLRSAPKVFNAMADALEWIVKANGARFLWHYLDDFITVGSPGSGECGFNCSLFRHMCNRLGVPLAEEKCEGPATHIIFLGIEIDSMAMELRLPVDKLRRIQDELQRWQSKKRCTKRDLQSLLGLLQHAAAVVRPGRTFLRRLYDLVPTAKAANHHLYLNAAARSDLAWWMSFIEGWNGLSLLLSQQPHHVVVSDASGHWGCGAYCDHSWFQLCWHGTPMQDESIMVKELIPVVIASAIWGRQWIGHTVQCKCDNEAVVAVITSRTSKNVPVMHLLRCLFFFEATFNFAIKAMHLPGATNELADDLSRNRLSLFLQKSPQMDPEPHRIPPELRDLLFTPIDWTSQHWRCRFSAILTQV